MNRLMAWLVREWPYAGFLAGVLLLALFPLWVYGMGLALALVYVQLPAYMLHQLEEHAGDRFRRFVNDSIGGGREVLTPQATLWINVLGVWVVNLVALYLAAYISLGVGLISVYLIMVNAVAHAAGALVLRSYNPGLWTGLFLFLPLGALSLYEITTSGAGLWAHVLGILVAVAIHAAIVVHVRRRLGALPVRSSDARTW